MTLATASEVAAAPEQKRGSRWKLGRADAKADAARRRGAVARGVLESPVAAAGGGRARDRALTASLERRGLAVCRGSPSSTVRGCELAASARALARWCGADARREPRVAGATGFAVRAPPPADLADDARRAPRPSPVRAPTSAAAPRRRARHRATGPRRRASRSIAAVRRGDVGPRRAAVERRALPSRRTASRTRPRHAARTEVAAGRGRGFHRRLARRRPRAPSRARRAPRKAIRVPALRDDACRMGRARARSARRKIGAGGGRRGDEPDDARRRRAREGRSRRCRATSASPPSPPQRAGSHAPRARAESIDGCAPDDGAGDPTMLLPRGQAANARGLGGGGVPGVARACGQMGGKRRRRRSGADGAAALLPGEAGACVPAPPMLGRRRQARAAADVRTRRAPADGDKDARSSTPRRIDAAAPARGAGARIERTWSKASSPRSRRTLSRGVYRTRVRRDQCASARRSRERRVERLGRRRSNKQGRLARGRAHARALRSALGPRDAPALESRPRNAGASRRARSPAPSTAARARPRCRSVRRDSRGPIARRCAPIGRPPRDSRSNAASPAAPSTPRHRTASPNATWRIVAGDAEGAALVGARARAARRGSARARDRAAPRARAGARGARGGHRSTSPTGRPSREHGARWRLRRRPRAG